MTKRLGKRSKNVVHFYDVIASLTVVPFVRVIATIVLAVSLERRLDTATVTTFKFICNSNYDLAL